VGDAPHGPRAAGASVQATLEPGDEHRDLVITAPCALGTLAVELLDHHRLPIQRWTRRIGAGRTRIPFDPHLEKLETTRGTMRFRVGRWSGYSELHCMGGCWISPPE
jgi:hypothetical protein